MKRMLQLGVLMFCLFMGATSLSAQSIDHIQGEILVKIKTDANIRRVTRQIQQLGTHSTQLKVKKILSKSFGLYQLTFDYTTINEEEMLAAVWRAEEVEIAQFNHVIKKRVEPNDAQFEDQWQYINTGQNGGVTGADIDADLAWDITTGGVTPQGDTIVCAALDDGIDTDHEDFEDNLWRNWGEIPNNGIDDDGNGYVDDFAGWNSNSDNDNIEGGGHGTPVAGIIGAKGNNGIGVAGMSWDVKVMVIKNDFNTNEANVLAAYSYPLTMRQRYNETNGAEGAFVVSTNASWGIDGGQPANAPLWCAFYDTLGVHGIVSCGATINGNQNVDTFGDLPTACPSDYLISVTNMNSDDVKVTQAGYGLETIDLGAFGADTWTTAANNGYGGFGGTSGATPHVTGAIGLLYSAPCSNFIALAKNDPGAAALLAKEYILNGVDPNASLEGITVTGGRLNINNSLMALLEECGPCPAPSALNATDLTVDGAILSWISTDSTLTSTLSWREVGAADWNVVENATSPYTLTDLLACTDYEFQVEDSCANDEMSDPSLAYSFRTDGCCEAPANLMVDYDGTTATVTWDALTAATAYNIMLSSALGTEVTEDYTDTQITFTDFAECEVYTVQVQTICADGTITDFTAPVTFTSTGCGQCVEGDYCINEASTEFEHIASFTLEDINNESGDDGGYGNYTTLSTNLTQGITYFPVIEIGFADGAFNELVKIWVDLNQDDVFEASELLYASDPTEGPVFGEIVIPFDALLGPTRMRVMVNYAPAGDLGPCETGFEGEVEDYCVNILEGMLTCDEVPAGLATTAVTQMAADVIWQPTNFAQSYDLRYKEVLETDWTEVTGLTATTYTIDGLEICTDYEMQVKAICDDNLESAYSASSTFTTECITCDVIPSGLDTMMTTTNTADITWMATDNAVSYNVRHKKLTDTDWTETTGLTATTHTIENLDICTEYEMQVKAVCEDNLESEYSASSTFITRCPTSVVELPTEFGEVNVYPNPFDQRFLINMNVQTATDISVRLMDTNGKVLIQQSQWMGTGEQQIEVQVNRTLPQGLYWVQIQTETGVITKRLVH